MWACLECATRGCTDWIPQAGLGMSYVIGRVLWYIRCCGVSLALAKWYWLDLHILQVINITRLNAIYQGSRKILISLIVTFLAVNIYNVAVAVMTTMHTLVGTPNFGWKQMRTWLIDAYQRKALSLAPISAQLATRKISHFWFPFVGYSLLRGRSSHCVL